MSGKDACRPAFLEALNSLRLTASFSFVVSIASELEHKRLIEELSSTTEVAKEVPSLGRGTGRACAGDVVALCFGCGISQIVAVLKAGGTLVPLDPDDPALRKELMIAECGAKVLIAYIDGPELSKTTQQIRPGRLRGRGSFTVEPRIHLGSSAALLAMSQGSTPCGTSELRGLEA
ncbi:hypothetical protein EV363DRAFT_1454498 [Boletus edulis]|nr:hypothetical protein EV363DRAFT_1454498 [Boletus edulis]